MRAGQTRTGDGVGRRERGKAFLPAFGGGGMDRVRAVGIALVVAAVAGYLVGIRHAYPGRALSVTGVMVGLTLVAVGGESG